MSFVNVKVIQGSSSKVGRPLPVQPRIASYLVSHNTSKSYELCHAWSHSVPPHLFSVILFLHLSYFSPIVHVGISVFHC